MSFSEKVLTAVQRIPRGQTKTYKEIAEQAGSPEAYRAVGSILRKNTNKNIPCHRVVKSNGDLGQYNGLLAETKKEILAQEKM